jgi:hypothetical protein
MSFFLDLLSLEMKVVSKCPYGITIPCSVISRKSIDLNYNMAEA